jgi:dTDP-4-amino-4,6-dideoxygalactose transaminase
MAGPPVPFLDLRAATDELVDELSAAADRVLRSGWYLLGQELEAFEHEWAAFTGTAHCVGVGNGLDALRLSLLALGVGPGDEVVVPANTYIATWLAVTQVGATPVPVEPDPTTYTIDPDLVAGAITPRTRAILPVHLYGHPADMSAICAVARDAGLAVLGDAAQAHGARFGGQRVGGLADIEAWSFYPSKNLGALGDGGAITTDDAALADRIRTLRNYGSREKYVNDEPGWNSRLDEIQAAVLRVKLAHLDEWNARRSSLATRYLHGLADGPVALPSTADDVDAVWHVFVVRTRTREALMRHLADRGIGVVIHYPIPPHLQEAYRDLGIARGSLPLTETIHDEVMSLPMGPHLSTAQADQVIEAVRSFA